MARLEPPVVVRRRAAAIVVATGAAVVFGVCAYLVADKSSLFALRKIEVEGASPRVAATVRRALAPYVGRSLVAFDASGAQRRLAAMPSISVARFDRAFPHTLKVAVRLERPVGVLRQGAAAWLVAASARVVKRLERKPYPSLPRIWVPRDVDVQLNSTLSGSAAAGVAAVAPQGSRGVGAVVRSVRTGAGELTIVLGGGREVRLGNTSDLRLKLAIARRILPLTIGASYVDVTIPERPVAGFNSQAEG